MNQVLPHALWLGHARDGENFQAILGAGVRAVVYVSAEEPPVSGPRDLVTCRFPLLDGAGNRSEMLFLAISTVATLLKLHVPTLVCCSMGISRAPAVAAAALAMLHAQPPEQCLQRVVEHHTTDISPGFWNEVVGVLAGLQ
jgi:hypothetical protein